MSLLFFKKFLFWWERNDEKIEKFGILKITQRHIYIYIYIYISINQQHNKSIYLVRIWNEKLKKFIFVDYVMNMYIKIIFC